jgi:hypothetical protein
MPYHLTAGENFFDRDLKMLGGGLNLGFKLPVARCRLKWHLCCELSTNIVHQAFRKQPCYSFVEFAAAGEYADEQRKSYD